MDEQDVVAPTEIQSMDELVSKCGYNCSEFEVQTKDDYILKLYRIQPKLQNMTQIYKQRSTKKHSVVLLHDLLADASSWMCNKNPQSLPFMLVQSNYDVWLAESRGARNSQRHATLDSTLDDKYWKFSFTDMGEKDFPAIVDKVLEETNKEKLHWIGHSQGSLVCMTGLSEKPSFNNKVASLHGIGAVFKMGNFSDSVKMASNLFKNTFSASSRGGQFTMKTPISDFIWNSLNLVSKEISKTSVNGLLKSAGLEIEDYFGNDFYCLANLSGTSLHNLLHYTQCIDNNETRKLDFGENENLLLYNNIKPPLYDLSKVTCPTYLYFGTKDLLVPEQNIKYLTNNLTQLNQTQLIQDFDHYSYIWNKNAPQLLYKTLIENLQDAENVMKFGNAIGGIFNKVSEIFR